MAKNELLIAAINSPDLATKDEAARNAALDALLAATPENIEQVLREHQEFWKLIEIKEKGAADNAFTRAWKAFFSAAAIEEQEEEIEALLDLSEGKLKEIQQAAALQRVKLGLKGFSKGDEGQDALLTLLGNQNIDECKNYINRVIGALTTSVPGLTPANIATALNPGDMSNLVANYHLLQLIEGAVEEAKLLALIQPMAGIENIRAAAIALGFSGDPTLLIGLIAEIKDAVDRRIVAVKKQAAVAAAIHEIEAQEALDDVDAPEEEDDEELEEEDDEEPEDDDEEEPEDDDEEELEDDDEEEFHDAVEATGLEAQLILLQKMDDKVFIQAVNKHYQNRLAAHDVVFQESDAPKLRETLGARYLKIKLADHTGNLAPALKAADEGNVAQLKVELKKLFPGDNAYIDKAVSADNLKSLQSTMVANAKQRVSVRIAGMKLPDLNKCDGLNSLRDLAKILGPAALYINDGDLLDFQKIIRQRRFELLIAAVSPGGAAARPELVTAFNALESKEQLALLASPTNLVHIVNARSPDVIKHYLGSLDEATINTIDDENQNKNRLSTIQNAALRKLLQDLDPPIHLMSGVNDEINELLKNTVSLNSVVAYKQFVDDIKRKLFLTNAEIDFYSVFGLNQNGTAFADEAKFVAIQTQLVNNYELVQAREMYTSEVNEKLFGVFLRIEKTQPISYEEAEIMRSLVDVSIDANTYIEKFVNAYTAHVADTTRPRPTDEDIAKLKTKLTAELKRELTPALFTEIKEGKLKQYLHHGNLQDATQALIAVEENLVKVHESLAPVQKQSDVMKAISEVNAAHLYNPTFREKAMAIQDKYQKLSDDCDLMISKLLRDRAALQTLKDSMPVHRKDLDNRIVQSKVESLRKQLDKELKEVDAQLAVFKEAKQNLSAPGGILDAIKASASGSQHYVYQAAGVSSQILAKDNVPKTEMEGNPLDATGAVEVNNTGNTLNFILDQQPDPGDKRLYAIEHLSSRGVKSEARIIDEVLDHNAKPVTSNNGIVKGNPPVRISLIQPPKTAAADGKFADPKDESEALANAAMVAAALALSKLDGPPTKNNQLVIRGNEKDAARLWTALIILGENNPKMKFGPEAIRIHGGCTFDPEKQKAPLLKRVFNSYAPDSLYNTDFKEAREQIERVSKASQQLTKDRFNPHEIKKAEEHVDKAIKISEKSREQMTILRKTEAQRTKTEGVAPKPPESPKP